MITIYEYDVCVKREQVRFPKSKKKRTRMKWARRMESYKTTPLAFRVGNDIICHPSIAARFREELREVNTADIQAVTSSAIFSSIL